jgi:SAM-dependent methyltransferase
MEKQNYDDLIAEHYRKVAQQDGLEPTSTMADNITRGKETDAIIEFVGDVLRRRQTTDLRQPVTIMDVGCGNGYTLGILTQRFPGQIFTGIEKSADLRELAISRFKGKKNITILDGDIRDPGFSKGFVADVLICQRVLINLLEPNDQNKALGNLVEAVKSPHNANAGGVLLFIEAFSSSLDRLNEARAEFDLPAIGPAHHNLYLQDGFFNIPMLRTYQSDGFSVPPNFLSTHYFVTRVLHPIFIKDKPFKRNSEFIKFFTQALRQNVGDYSPLKLLAFERS